MMRLFVLTLFVSALPLTAQQTAKSFEAEVRKEVGLQYLLSLPEGYEQTADKRWPLLLFLHGAGERGKDLRRVKVHGPPKLVATTNLPFVVVSPQCPKDTWWHLQTDALSALLDHIESTQKIDAERIYLTGLSMGGFGTWALSAREPRRFAAIAPICGGGEPLSARWTHHIPTWVFHGDKDGVVPIARSQQMVDALKRRGASKLKFTVYPGVGHDSWTSTYANPELYRWFLSHTLAR